MRVGRGLGCVTRPVRPVGAKGSRYRPCLTLASRRSAGRILERRLRKQSRGFGGREERLLGRNTTNRDANDSRSGPARLSCLTWITLVPNRKPFRGHLFAESQSAGLEHLKLLRDSFSVRCFGSEVFLAVTRAGLCSVVRLVSGYTATSCRGSRRSDLQY